ncbi:uncharacterized protein DS421_12g359360 [Arachis hypogaea]|nr:uncharacterized protein DS421_12g359360 [Arachis hypogaea]
MLDPHQMQRWSLRKRKIFHPRLALWEQLRWLSRIRVLLFFKAGHKRQRPISLQNSPTEVLSTDSRVQKELDKASATTNLENQLQQKNDGSATQVHQKTIGDRGPST